MMVILLNGVKEDQNMGAARNAQNSVEMDVSFPGTGGTTGNLIVASPETIKEQSEKDETVNLLKPVSEKKPASKIEE
eukprot:9326784-Ditylum_brightwellii.AAC.1